MPATHKLVNGVNVPLSPEEAAAIEAEWAANPPPTAQQMLAALRQRAVALLASEQAEDARLMRAVVLTVLDELNAHAAKINSILTAIDNGANLAAVKANVAAITDYPTRTAQQVRTTIANKIDNGDADS